MNGVKGLIRKEFYLRRKTMLIGLTILILVFILAVSFCLSCDYGNLKNREDLDADRVAVILVYTVSALSMILFCQNGEVIIKDKKCKWNVFEQTLPLSPQKLGAIRSGTLLCCAVLGLIVSALLSSVILAVSHKKFDTEVFANISVMALLVFAMITLVNFLYLKYGDPEKTAACLFGSVFAVGILLSFFAYKKLTELQVDFPELDEEKLGELLVDEFLTPLAELRDRLFPFFILFFAAIAVIGYFLFLSQYKRREK